MKAAIKYCLCLLFLLGMSSCHHKSAKKSYDEVGQSGLTIRTEYLRTNLKSITEKGLMIGHENSTVEGVGWSADSTHSDIQSCCDDYPAVLGFELSGIERGSQLNADSIRFDIIRKAVIAHFKKGGVNVFNWNIPTSLLKDDHQLKNDIANAARYLNSLQNGYGIKCPLLLALHPFAESGSQVSPAMYKSLWNTVVGALKQAGVNHVLYVYSIDESMASNSSRIEACYPGDDKVDFFELRYITSASQAHVASYDKVMHGFLEAATNVARRHNKLIGLRTGLIGMTVKDWWTKTLLPLLKNYRLTYVMLGKNKGSRENNNFCVPFPGNITAADFVQFYNDPYTLFMSDVNGLYLDHSPQKIETKK